MTGLFMWHLLAMLLGSLASSTQVQLAESASEEIYTLNPVCQKNNCVNPFAPGLYDLPKLENMAWQCVKEGEARKFLHFCKDAIFYDPAIPSPKNSTPLDKMVRAQDGAASMSFFYHLSGLGYEAWQNRDPKEFTDPCVRKIYELACYTYFPKQEAGCKEGKQVPFLRPCRNACSTYLDACEVNCCDDSTQCVFEHTAHSGVVETGYPDVSGPSAICTGGSNSGSSRVRVPFALLLSLLGLHLASTSGSSKQNSAAHTRLGGCTKWALAAVMVLCASMLQGCAFLIPSHRVPNWKKNKDYLVEYEYVPKDEPQTAASLNSCMTTASQGGQVCSGRGSCKSWSHQPLKMINANETRPQGISFCKCDPGWADPECRTQRKSQFVSFFLSLFLGVFGADHFYLGHILSGVLKLVTLGGIGLWWLFDVVRTGSGPVYASDFKVNPDLPHWAYMLIILLVFSAAGLLYSLDSMSRYRKRKHLETMKTIGEEESRTLDNMDLLESPVSHSNSMFGKRTFHRDYGATLPVNYPSAGAPLVGGPGMKYI